MAFFVSTFGETPLFKRIDRTESMVYLAYRLEYV